MYVPKILPFILSLKFITFINFETNTPPDIDQKKPGEKSNRRDKGYKSKAKMKNATLARENEHCNLG